VLEVVHFAAVERKARKEFVVVKTLAKLTIGIAILAVSAWFGTSSSRAYGDAPWCTVINIGPGTVYCDCQYRTIEECVPDVIGGNRGFCNLNPWRVRFRQSLTNIKTDMLERIKIRQGVVDFARRPVSVWRVS
jgi:hypothetical protein